MSKSRIARSRAATVCLSLAVWAGAVTAAPADDTAFFESRVRPVLIEHCYACHTDGKKTKGGLALDHRQALLRGGDSGPAVVPGDPDKSKLIEAVRYKNHDLQMPPDGPLTDAQVRDLAAWVKMGAPDPRHPTTAPAPAARPGIDLNEARKFWSFAPLTDPALPAVNDAAWPISPVDAFILAQLEHAGLRPAPPADRATLIRRASFDLTGLPPTPAEVDAFVSDTRPDAFARLVDRLLASPQYGQRWARHWLDVARYADSNGMDENVAYANAWRYRDYVVDAFNADKPYDQFLVEQIAGDLLPASERPTRDESLTATGFLALGAKVLAEPDLRKLEMDVIDEQLDTLGKAFLGMTFGCARCHDHKFDPVSTADYYALAAIFRGTISLSEKDKGTVKFWHETSIATPAQTQENERHLAKVAALKAELKRLQTKLATKPATAPATQPVVTPQRLKEQIKALEDAAPELPAVMSVKDGAVVKSLPIHIRGSYLTLGAETERGVPQVMRATAASPIFPNKHSGRLELARWMVRTDHPLTARVMVNRIWRWHFGRGIVATPDNFGLTGDKPSHPALLDFLARRFIQDGWSVKDLHRLLLNSRAYQMASAHPDPATSNAASAADPENRLLSRFNVRRLEAEEIFDALLAVGGTLDLRLGGKTLPLKNREYVFHHTSRDATTYDSRRRALYIPIVRNHLYDLLEQFDFPDPTMPTGSRNATVVAPQALIMLNAPVVMDAAATLARKLRAADHPDDAARLRHAYATLYARPATPREIDRALAFLNGQPDRGAAWSLLCHTLLAANEFLYLR